ncbi:uncharacterized protein LOC135584527 isoform X5 [Musa acuminata AAA Group]|uniref:uncharacterized protein LOC135584527 isoform X5 n=1 Tax=Musa acuminata AAA Group TaxID=214697 RepID=UPI0031D16D61
MLCLLRIADAVSFSGSVQVSSPSLIPDLTRPSSLPDASRPTTDHQCSPSGGGGTARHLPVVPPSLLARSLPSTPLSLSLSLSLAGQRSHPLLYSVSLSPVRRVGLARTHALEAVALSPSSFSMASSLPLHFFRRPCPPLSLSSRSPPSSARPPVANQLHSFVEVWKMAATKHFPRMVSHVILDLDGTLLNTDGVMNEVLKVFLVKYGKRWDNKISQKIIGRTPLEVATAVVKDFSLSLTTEDLMSAISPMFSDQWCNIKALPGANRLIKHLRSNGVTLALASNSSKSCIEAKISFHQGWKESFSVIIGGDEVTTGKPSPEIFLEAAKRMNVDISNCLVIEDSLPGVVAGKAAGMAVVAVPSLPKQAGLYSSADVGLKALYQLNHGILEDLLLRDLVGAPRYLGYQQLIYLQKIFLQYSLSTHQESTLAGQDSQQGASTRWS